MLRVLVYKSAEQPGEVQELDGSLPSLQKIVGGYIETTPLFFSAGIPILEPLVAMVNEDGLLIGLPYNRGLHGPFFIVRLGEEKFLSLTDSDIALVRRVLDRFS